MGYYVAVARSIATGPLQLPRAGAGETARGIRAKPAGARSRRRRTQRHQAILKHLSRLVTLRHWYQTEAFFPNRTSEVWRFATLWHRGLRVTNSESASSLAHSNCDIAECRHSKICQQLFGTGIAFAAENSSPSAFLGDGGLGKERCQ